MLCCVVSDGSCSVVLCLMMPAVLCCVASDGSCSVMAAAAVCHGVVSAGVWNCSSCVRRLLDHPSVAQSALSLPLFRRGVPACLSATLTRLGDSSRLALGRGVPLSQRRSEPADFSRPQPVTLRHSSGNQSPLCLSTYQFLVCHEFASNSIISSTSTRFFRVFARCWDLGSSTYPPTVIDYPVSPWFAVLVTPLNHCRR